MSSLENALRILALLSKERPVLRVGEVCREMKIPKSSVSRLLKTLSDHGLIERQGNELGYVSGKRALILADLYLANHTLIDLIDVSLDALIADFQFAAYAAVLSGPDIIILRVKHGSYPLRLVQQVGKPLPAHTTAIGQVLLARKPLDEAIELVKERVESPAELPEIVQQLQQAHKIGTALTADTIIPGVSALGVAIHDPSRSETLGFSISYPTAASDGAMRARMTRRIREEARAIGSRVNDPYWAIANDVGEAPPRTRTVNNSARISRSLSGANLRKKKHG
jgi:DNA-binding IclR family transcriptional regulator